MVQLKVYPQVGALDSEAIFLDLYETQPIKLNLSIEDITSADATSVFSRTFKVPATRDNNEFFQNAWELDGIDFDITIKKPAQILVDGTEFKVGHVRLQKIYSNEDQDKIDYELLFLGETRDFSSIIADKPMCQLVMTDFDWPDNPVAYTNAADFIGPFGYNDIAVSWNAFPENASLTAGYADGDLLFPLIDHGNTYTGITPDQGVISIDGTGKFTQPGNALALDRFKPMIRAKRLWDQIFEDSGYTYTSTFLNSERFHQMYVSAFGNEERIGMNVGQTTTTIFQSSNPSNFDNYVDGYMYNSNVSSNVGGHFNQGSVQTGSYFVAPGTASVGGNYYLFNISAEIDAVRENSDQGFSPVPAYVELVKVSSIGSSSYITIADGNPTQNGNTSSITYDSRNGGYQIQQGDILQVRITATGGVDVSQVDNTYWDCTAAPGDYYAPADLDCDYRQIDYIKDVLTMFRLVMQPDALNPYNFIIEPWQDFIGSGTVYDWSNKLIRQKDFVSEPLFNTQSAEIEFTKQEDEDYINQFHQDNNKHAYGWLRFDSQNELLKGKREVEVLGIAPTPIDQIEHGSNAPHPYPQFIIPTIHKHEAEGGAVLHLPIKPKTRFLFYNGEQPIAVAQDDWYMLNDTGNAVLQDKWPLVSPYEDWPVQTTSLNLNFLNDTRYYLDPSPGVGYFAQGSTLYNEYWSRYINSLYNKFSRRVTAYFTLNNVDLQDLTFDDVIFIDGKYYRPEKIMDAQVGERTAVKCQLITLKDQRPVWRPEPLTGFSIIDEDGQCAGEQGSIQVTTDGTPPFTWQLGDPAFQTGTYNAPVGGAPYIFTINNVPLGSDVVIVTDTFGRTAQATYSVTTSSATPIQANIFTTAAQACTAPCDGEITVQPTGGSGGYTVYWSDGTVQNTAPYTRTGLCPGTYSFYIEDSSFCQSQELSATIECAQTEYVYQLRKYLESCAQSSIQTYIATSTVAYAPGTTVDLFELRGCFYIESETNLTPNYTINNDYPDCESCNPETSTTYEVQSCTGPEIYFVDRSIALVPGQVVELADYPGCFEVVGDDVGVPQTTVTQIYDNCETCENQGGVGYSYLFVFCDGSGTGVYRFTSNLPLRIGEVVIVQDSTVPSYIGKCVEVVAETTSGTIWGDVDDSPNYDSCNACQGITADTCHEVVVTGSGAEISYTQGGQVYNLGFQVGTWYICATNPTVIGGTATITNLNTPCISNNDCLPQQRATCHTLYADPVQGATFEFRDSSGQLQSFSLAPSAVVDVCAQQNSVQVIAGIGSYQDNGTFCINDGDCQR